MALRGRREPESGDLSAQEEASVQSVVHCPGSAPCTFSCVPLALRNNCVFRLIWSWDSPTAGFPVCWDENSSDLPPFPLIT